MTVLCDECGIALSPNDDDIYHGSGAYCPAHHPRLLRKQELRELRLLAERQGIQSYDLDGFVHDQKAKEATDINNGDLPAQIAYLHRAWGKEFLETLLRDWWGEADDYQD